MKIKLFEEFISDNANTVPSSAKRLILDIYKEAKKSKNFSKVTINNTYLKSSPFIGETVTIISKRYEQVNYAEYKRIGGNLSNVPFEEFEIGYSPEENAVIVSTDTGHDEVLNSLNDFIKFSGSRDKDINK